MFADSRKTTVAVTANDVMGMLEKKEDEDDGGQECLRFDEDVGEDGPRDVLWRSQLGQRQKVQEQEVSNGLIN